MVIIITDQYDVSTCDVLDWLNYYQIESIVVTNTNQVSIYKIENDGHFTLEINQKKINTKKIKGIWYRRGNLGFEEIKFHREDDEFKVLPLLSNYLNIEFRRIINYFHFKFFQLNHIGNYLKSDLNKLVVLDIVRRCSIRFPETLITSSKNELLKFKKKHGRIITKSTIKHVFFGNDDFHLYAYTEGFTDDDLNNVSENFFPSLFQAQIDKRFEVRSFFIDGNFYSMAIFSQLNSQTQVDFRKYDKKKPNRRVPFLLPKKYKKKLIKLMKKLRLNSGSIDIIYGKDEKFYFLEVNPIGQFGMTSKPCNFFLEKEIARKLINSKGQCKIKE